MKRIEQKKADTQLPAGQVRLLPHEIFNYKATTWVQGLSQISSKAQHWDSRRLQNHSAYPLAIANNSAMDVQHRDTGHICILHSQPQTPHCMPWRTEGQKPQFRHAAGKNGRPSGNDPNQAELNLNFLLSNYWATWQREPYRVVCADKVAQAEPLRRECALYRPSWEHSLRWALTALCRSQSHSSVCA